MRANVTGGLEFVMPDWPAPTRVRAVVTTRRGGVSIGPYASLNLAAHVGDDSAAVITYLTGANTFSGPVTATAGGGTFEGPTCPF